MINVALKWGFISGLMLTTAACDLLDNPPDEQPAESEAENVNGWETVTPDSDAMVALKEAMVNKSNLFDPFSVQYRNVVAKANGNKDGVIAIRYCGNVNAKNKYGAYTGWQFMGAVATSKQGESLNWLIGIQPLNEKAIGPDFDIIKLACEDVGNNN